MAVSLSLSRPKATTTNALSFDLSNGTAVETDTGSEESVFIPFNLASTNPASFTVSSVTTTSGNTTLTTTNAGFANVKPGDVLSGTGIDTGAVVVSVAANGNTLVMDLAATASGSITLTVDPPAGTPTVFGLKIKYSGGGNTLTLTPTLYLYNGSLPPGTAGTAANATEALELKRADGKPIVIDADSFLTRFRVARGA